MGFVTKAVRVNQAGQIADGVITGAKLADNSITADKIGILDYIRALQYDLYNYTKSTVEFRLQYQDANNKWIMFSADNIGTLYNIIEQSTANLNDALVIGGRVSALSMQSRRIIDLGQPISPNDSLRYGQAEIRDAEISATANISRSKLQSSALQRATGSVFPGAGGDFDITALITPVSYPCLAIGFASGDVYTKLALSSLVLKSDAGGDWATVPYASVNDSGSIEGVANGHVNTVSALVTSGSVKLTHRQDATELGNVVSGVLVVISV